MPFVLAILAMAIPNLPFDFHRARHEVRGTNIEHVQVALRSSGDLINSQLKNNGSSPAKIDEVVLFDLPTKLPADTKIYGEGFTMLSQTGGTIGHPVDIGAYTDHEHYRLPVPTGATTVYNVLTLTSPASAETHLLGFSTCRRFAGHFNIFPTHIEVVLDMEGLVLRPGATWNLEEFMFESGPDRRSVLDRLADRIVMHSGRLRFAHPPTGWCSWQTFGTSVTAGDVRANVRAIARKLPGLKYVQIDDGYQAHTGDWLETGRSFGGGIQAVLKDIRANGLEPAIWVAPFVASGESNLFHDHPDWFVMDDSGKPLRSDRVTFGGWQSSPWYVLDGTNPGARGYLEHVFHTMRRDWGCTYFKLDALTWGAIKGGHFHNPNATRVEAYRQGMAAIRRGAGDAFILGGNHPVWPAIGTIDGQRSGMDIDRSWQSFSSTARENLCRAWQNGKLWWNDPDTVLLTGELAPDEFQFHASVILATGGLVLSGDDTTKLSSDQIRTLKKLLPPSGVAARFTDDSFKVGYEKVRGETRVFLLNWNDQPSTERFTMEHSAVVTDLWSGTKLGKMEGEVSMVLPPRSARVLTYR